MVHLHSATATLPTTLTVFREAGAGRLTLWFISTICLLKITDSRAKNYQRNSDVWVGFRLTPMSVFALQCGGGISQEKFAVYWGFFEYVHSVRALLPSLLIPFFASSLKPIKSLMLL